MEKNIEIKDKEIKKTKGLGKERFGNGRKEKIEKEKNADILEDKFKSMGESENIYEVEYNNTVAKPKSMNMKSSKPKNGIKNQKIVMKRIIN